MAATPGKAAVRKAGTAAAAKPVLPENGSGEAQYETLEFEAGDEQFMHEGRRFGPGKAKIDLGSNEENQRVLTDLEASKDRVAKERETRMSELRDAGIANPTPAPIHTPVSE